MCNNEQNYCSNMADCAGMNASRPTPTTNNITGHELLLMGSHLLILVIKNRAEQICFLIPLVVLYIRFVPAHFYKEEVVFISVLFWYKLKACVVRPVLHSLHSCLLHFLTCRGNYLPFVMHKDLRKRPKVMCFYNFTMFLLTILINCSC